MIKNKVVLNTSKKINIDCTLFSEDANLTIASNKKTLGVSAVSKISNYEILNGELRVAGKITYKILYLSDEDIIMAYDYNKEFIKVILIPDIEPNDKALLFSNILDLEYNGVSEVNIKLTLGINGYYIKDEEIEFLDCLKDNILTKKTTINLEKIYMLTESNIEISKDFESKEALLKILSYHTNCIVDNIYAYDELYQIEGEAVTNIIGLSGDNKLVNQNFTQPFTLEIPDSNITPYAEFLVACTAKSTTIILEAEASNSLIIDLEINLKGLNIQKIETEVIADAYSRDRELIVEEKEIILCSEIQPFKKIDSITSSIRVDDDIQKIISVVQPLYTTMTTINNFGLYAEGVVIAQIIYLNRENQIKTIKTEIPYQILIDKDTSTNGNIFSELFITDASIKQKTANEMELIVKLIINAQADSVQTISIINNITEGKEKELEDVAISLYIAEDGETLWNVAKALSTDQETLVKLNPNLDFEQPLKNGDKILLYREFSL